MKITRIAAVGLIAASLSVAGFAGCGGSDSSSSAAADTAAAADTTAADTTGTTGGEMTKDEFIAAANKVCTEGEAAIKAAQEGADASSLEGLQSLVSGSADAAQTFADNLKAVTPPADLADAYSAYLAKLDAVIANNNDLATTLSSSTDVTEALKAIDEAAATEKSVTAESAAAAKELGLTDCVGSGGSSSSASNG